MKFLTKKQKGFTLIELMVSIFVFLIIVSIVIEIFGKQVVTSRHARILQRNIEDAEYAMNYMAKTLRTSTLPTDLDLEIVQSGQVTSVGSTSQESVTKYVDTVYAYDYSQKACFKFAFEDESLKVYKAEKEISEDENLLMIKHACAVEGTYSSVKGRKLTSGKVKGSFYISPTRRDTLEEEGEIEVYDESLGKITISLEIDNRMSESVAQEEEGVQNMVIIQTSVALRDYPEDLTF